MVHTFLNEDIGWGDVTTEAIVPEEAVGEAIVRAKADGLVAGLPIAAAVFRELDPHMTWTEAVCEGDNVQAGQELVQLKGKARAILTGERVALNLLQRLSGIATTTRAAVQAVEDTDCLILDTRKTTPGLRLLEKYAVKVGGGRNHRFSLADAVMVKDNHIAFAGGIEEAVHRVRRSVGPTVKIEVEAETLAQVREALAAGVDIIMLDNMDVETMREAVRLIASRALSEASGGLKPESVARVARTGVSAISLGWLTHSARALDISLEFTEVLE
nr:carboxylating nicotinate-nucleotide diphosphorylase [Numidum massiliense]